MKTAVSKFKKISFIVISFTVILLIIVFIITSPFTKYLVEKYDEEYTGRQIKADWVYVNPFTGFVHISGLKIYEYKSNRVFIAINSVTANFTLTQLISGTIDLTELTLNQPHVEIIQKNRNFNFDDLVAKFSSKDTSVTTKKPLHFYFQNIKINGGHFYYIDEILCINFSLKNVNIESSEGWFWNKDFISAKFSFLSEKNNGGMKGNYSMNLRSLDYSIRIAVHNFSMQVIAQYLKEYLNYGTFRASLNANLNTKGCYKNAKDITIKGQLVINDFHLGKSQNDDYFTFKKLAFDFTDVNPSKRRYFIKKISLLYPYFKFEKYKYSDNLQRMFNKNKDNTAAAKTDEFNLVLTIANYIKLLANNFFLSDYNVNKLDISSGAFHFDDYSMKDKFSILINPLFVTADSINKDQKWVNFIFKSGIKPFGNIFVDLNLNPNDSSDFDMQYKLQNVSVPMFNPYLVAYTSFPMDRGILGVNGVWNVRKGIIKSKNHVLLIDPHLGSKVKNSKSKRIPMRLIMFFIREGNNSIDYEIPITGNLKKPEFHFRDIFTDILKNIITKPLSLFRKNYSKNSTGKTKK